MSVVSAKNSATACVFCIWTNRAKRVSQMQKSQAVALFLQNYTCLSGEYDVFLHKFAKKSQNSKNYLFLIVV